MARSTVHYADNKTNNTLKKLHNKLRPAGTPVQRVEYIIELLLLRIFETKVKQDDEFKPLRKLFDKDYKWLNPKTNQEESNENKLFSYLFTVSNDQILPELNNNFFPFYSTILSSARKVYEGNLPQKVQDQLVLIEEVFSNSNFTNNVNSGNLGEVISLCNEIEEERLLKTDLLGDAIESALSETGGTKDIGLHRTPEHIRHFMTALVEPNFDDTIFDPACGTGGFLFDAFEFVMRRVDIERTWPGGKSHKELRAWFDEYFKFNQLEFPNIQQSTQFYRSGVSGIEYLGMIRKMAAINFYIRGLNPANIDQGDALAKYNPVTDAASKTVLLANPPFGAERDQESYPDVWSEYSKESETTILFVKLMFELLKTGARCAVIVSEGFHTWDQFSAKALRKMLLDEANLKAIISLPQGLFVSKNGQGPKTSILLFEKGGTTDWVWFYKVTNDGYTMGTNRKEQPGCQLVECLTLYHEFVKHGKQPPESKYQFCIPAEWIKTLDPRIKEKIKTDTRIELEAKGIIERKKKTEELDKKLQAGKIDEAAKQMELKQFEHSLENRIQNEIAKRIDKVHNYSFNLANYKSTLSETQLQEWRQALSTIQPNGVVTLDEAYKKIKTASADNVATYIVKLNPANALEADIVREYISGLEDNEIAKHSELFSLKSIFKSSTKYGRGKLGELMHLKRNILKLENFNSDYRIVEKIKFSDGEIYLREISETGIDLQFSEKGDLIISKINFNQGATAVNKYGKVLCSLDYLVYEVDETQALTKFIHLMVRDKSFLNYIETNKPGGIKGRSKPEFIEHLEIPLPSLDEQNEIVTQIEKQKAIIEGADKVIENWDVDMEFVKKQDEYMKPVGEVCSFEYGEPLKESDRIVGEFPVVGAGNIIGYHNKAYIKKPTIVIGRRGATSGFVQWIDKDCFVIDTAFYVNIFNEEETDKKYLFYALKNLKLQQLQSGGAMPGINRNDAYKEKIYYPDIEIQKKIVRFLDAEMQAIQGLQKLKLSAQQKIEQILADIWGEVLEPTTETIA